MSRDLIVTIGGMAMKGVRVDNGVTEGGQVVDTEVARKSNRDLCIMACVFCKDPLFQRWIKEQAEADGVDGLSWCSEAGAKAFILSLCRVESRNELDTNVHAGARFLEQVRAPYFAWKETHENR